MKRTREIEEEGQPCEACAILVGPEYLEKERGLETVRVMEWKSGSYSESTKTLMLCGTCRRTARKKGVLRIVPHREVEEVRVAAVVL